LTSSSSSQNSPSLIFLLLTIVFFIVRILPGDPAALHFERNVTPEALEEFRRLLGINKPIHEQFIDYLVGLPQGDLGLSMQDFSPISSHISRRFPATLELTIYSMLFAVLLGVALGVKSSKNYDTVKDYTIRTFGIVTYAVPVFFLGMVLQFIFSIYLGWLPTGTRYAPRLDPPATITGLYTIPDTAFIGTGNGALWHLHQADTDQHARDPQDGLCCGS
jgi:peptide/nickel transport system permease protein